jgi:predicted dehydrogenase
MNERHERREFLEKLGIGAAGLLAAGYTSTALGFAANETINVGCIGTGGRCQYLMGALKKLPGAKIVAVCDVWKENLAEGRKLADPNAAAFEDHRRLLERQDVDAVIIATPDHLHVPITIDACAAGKHVYCEKPFTHNLAEGQAVLNAPNRHKLAVQVGMQQRSMPQFLKAFEIVRSGVLGEIDKVHLTWNRNGPHGRKAESVDPKSVDWKRFLGNAPEQPFDADRFRNWRCYWDFGGGVFTDLMVHYIDVVQWFLELDRPETATSIGSDFAKPTRDTPDSAQTLLRYPGRGVQVYFEATYMNARNGAMLEFMGTNATLYLDRGCYQIFPERKKRVRLKEDEMRMILGKKARGQDFYEEVPGEEYHLANWLESIRGDRKPRASMEAGVSAAAAAHLANQALRTGQVVHTTA